MNKLDEIKKSLEWIKNKAVKEELSTHIEITFDEPNLCLNVLDEALTQLAALRDGYVMVPKPVIKFLLGEDLLRGCFFGEKPPQMSDMPMEIWAKDFDAPQYKGEFFKYEPNDVRAGKYHRDDKYRALEAENEKLRAALAAIKQHSPNDIDVRIASDALDGL